MTTRLWFKVPSNFEVLIPHSLNLPPTTRSINMVVSQQGTSILGRNISINDHDAAASLTNFSTAEAGKPGGLSETYVYIPGNAVNPSYTVTKPPGQLGLMRSSSETSSGVHSVRDVPGASQGRWFASVQIPTKKKKITAERTSEAQPQRPSRRFNTGLHRELSGLHGRRSRSALLGALITYVLFGIFLQQLYQYVLNQLDELPRRDPPVLKCLVLAVALLQISLVYMMAETTWAILVLPSRLPGFQFVPPVYSAFSPVLGGSISLCVQSFFAWRIRTLFMLHSEIMEHDVQPTTSRWGAWVSQLRKAEGAVCFVILALCAGCTVTAQYVMAGIDPKALMHFTLAASIYMYRERSKVGFTKSALTQISRNTIENGLATTLCVGMSLVLYHTRPNDMISVALYANVLLASINSRVIWLKDGGVVRLDTSAFCVATSLSGTVESEENENADADDSRRAQV
ncbi:hypothetical protein FA15DRAFT_657163 [Coprinopsis marcescibilis]|uniref:DUF6534 domain-containing protein n=1 Tax=Coprinopsis marcescibilis TaxID=230819 RepID=A0A5C3KQP5_COPMA|nr:hypothetical protein FA15DRAFT_657163 [Coprinopsis marcescibilis]